VDITVKPVDGGKAWSLVDLLGRSMGRILEEPPEHFTIHPVGQAVETMRDLRPGPYASLDAALSKIETHTAILVHLSSRHAPACTGAAARPHDVRFRGTANRPYMSDKGAFC
jgi:hypothetical protein